MRTDENLEVFHGQTMAAAFLEVYLLSKARLER
jgi:hypothetical protein